MSEPSATNKPGKRNRNWIWLYVVLFVLTGTAIGINLLFNLQQQLTPEQLREARELWKRVGPADYQLKIVKELGQRGEDGPNQREVIKATIRGGRVTAASLNDRPLEERLWSFYDMPAWFDYIEEFQERDTAPGAGRVFCRAKFSPVDGHIIHYVRSSRAAGQRVELRIEMSP